MKKEITADMYNYNKFPGPKFQRLGQQILSEGIALNLLEDYKNAFNLTAFEQRFSALMLKFDYIVGDWGNEQLRLRGFYRDDQAVDSGLKISRLQDYLLEYCNYGCAYFVLENPAPQELPPEKEEEKGKGNRRRRRSRPNRKTRTEAVKDHLTQPDRPRQDLQRSKQKKKDKSRHFSIKNERENRDKHQQQERQGDKRGFIIRQK